MSDTSFLPPFPTGTNIRMLLQDCGCDSLWFSDAVYVSQAIQKCLMDVKLTYLKDTHHAFADGGYTLAVILSESHIVIHTWSEHSRLALVEISVCDFTQNNKDKTHQLADAIAKLFAPQKTLMEATAMIPRLSKPLSTGHGFYVDMDELIETRQSQWQRISIAQTKTFGTSLILDDVFQTTEMDHAFYHEPLVHVPMLHHAEPKELLICGGGDGGAAYEALKHPSVQRCDVVEIDEDVIAVSRAHLFSVHQGALDDKRVRILIEDAARYVRHHPTMYDIIIIDATNPIENGASLFSQDFYHYVKQGLKPGGIAGLHAGMPYIHKQDLEPVIHNINCAFQNALPYLSFVPSFGTVSCFYLCLPDDRMRLSKDETAIRLHERRITRLQQLSPEIMETWFAIPPNVQGLVHP